ncbi:transmembrane protein 223 [Diachasmimorpha longicaudata]|uniref:transmembrane protein 223 n=1 Tax=Diachasmimorpha longicaudata TaxID=58733 RepID=UPI0030B8A2B2
MFSNLGKISSSLRFNLLRTAVQTKDNVRCYGIVRSWGLQSRCHETSRTLRSSFPKFLIPKLMRSFADQSVIKINTNVANNVLLWKFERPKFFRNIAIFTVLQFTVLMTCSYAAWTVIPIYRNDMTWKDYFKKAYLSGVLWFFSAFSAIVTSVLIWIFIRKSLKYIILNKGGTSATLVTYHPFKESIAKVVPLEDLIVKKDRNDVGTFISLRVKGTRFFHLIDKQGTFVNPDLYDLTVGLDRTHKPVKKSAVSRVG